MFFVYRFYPNYLQLKAIVHHPYGGLSDGAEDNARTQEIGTSAHSSRTSPVVQIARASLPSTELEQPSGSSGADNCAGNIQDLAAGEDNRRKRAEPLEDEDQPNHSNSEDVAQHDAIVHDRHGNNSSSNQPSQVTELPSGKVRGTAFKPTLSGPHKVSNLIHRLAISYRMCSLL